MPHHVLDHPLVSHRLTELRDPDTERDRFRAIVADLAGMLTYEAARTLDTEPVKVPTPLGTADGERLRWPEPLVVPVLRAGLGMLDAVISMVGTAQVALIGLRRDEVTLQPTLYCDTVPPALDDRDVIVLDPMLATGGSLATACTLLLERGAGRIHALSLIAAPEGIETLAERCPTVEVWVAALDPGLNDIGYIVPGLGDAGDRLFGVLAP
jgi:uracil phosphoribosyltransferase